MHEFISLDFDNKKYLWEGKSVVKGNDISKGKIIMKETIELPDKRRLGGFSIRLGFYAK